MIKCSRFAALAVCAVSLSMLTCFTWGQMVSSNAQPGGQPPLAPTTGPAFMIGVWYQPLSSIPTWKARGVNTLVGCPEGDGAPTKADWAKAARDAGMYYIFKPASTPDAMLAESQDPNLLGWMLPDEPDGAGNLSPDQIIALYKSFKQVANVPVFLNLDGAVMQYRAANDYKKYCQGGDILAFDYYVANRGDAPLAIPTIGKRVDQLKSWGKGKPVVAFIECSDQQLWMQSWVTADLAARMRAPTPQEMTKEINLAVSHGAKGIVYFPDVIGAGWIAFDGVTPDLEAAMIDANAAIIAKATGQPIPPPTKGLPPKDGKGDRTGSQGGTMVTTDPTPVVPDPTFPTPDRYHQYRQGGSGQQ